MMSKTEKHTAQLYNDVCQIIDTTRSRLATTVNAEICLLNWTVGTRVKEEILNNQRADYGKQVVKKLSVLLTENYGKGWGYEKLKHCVRSAYLFSEEEIRYAVRTQLTWTHLRSLMSIEDDLKRSLLYGNGWYREMGYTNFRPKNRSDVIRTYSIKP